MKTKCPHARFHPAKLVCEDCGALLKYRGAKVVAVKCDCGQDAVQFGRDAVPRCAGHAIDYETK